jgi:diguanylate cyclase (GGDEF)-like protein/PAS domain S-box-containing protein
VKRSNTPGIFDALLTASPDHSYILNLDGRFIYANKALTDSFETPLSELVGKDFFDLGVADAADIHKQLRRVIDTGEQCRGEMSYSFASKGDATYEYVFSPVMDIEAKVEAIAGTARDVTERKASEEKTWKIANYDILTGLPNRRLFRDRLEQNVKHAERTGAPIALLFIDLDAFKEVNDLLGHDAGDLLLQQAANRISACVRSEDTVARLGGDEFTVVLTDVNKVEHVEIRAQGILDQLAQPFHILQQVVHVSGSIGITLFPQDATTPENLVRNADQAMYVAKNEGRNRFSFFTDSMRDSAWARLKVIEELRHALPQGQLTVYYQPIIDLSDGRIVKAEALLRWLHPQRGLVLPRVFIELAEESRLIVGIDNWVLTEAVRCSKAWSALLGKPFQISVNKSPVEFMCHARETNWEACLGGRGLTWNSISVEITEGVLLNASISVTEKLNKLQKAGIQLIIDDFGTGYSSMAYLKKFDIDYLKIDQSFVRDVTINADSRAIAETIIVMAHKLGLKVIAEGVETVEQRDWLETTDCDYAQGYLFSEPVPSQDFEKLLNRN